MKVSAVPVIQREFAPVKDGRIMRPHHVPVHTQKLFIETPFGSYVALVRIITTTDEIFIDSIRKDDGT